MQNRWEGKQAEKTGRKDRRNCKTMCKLGGCQGWTVGQAGWEGRAGGAAGQTGEQLGRTGSASRRSVALDGGRQVGHAEGRWNGGRAGNASGQDRHAG